MEEILSHAIILNSPSALATASKLIDDPYQIAVIRADAAGKELAKCLLQSDERRQVTYFCAKLQFLAKTKSFWMRDPCNYCVLLLIISWIALLSQTSHISGIFVWCPRHLLVLEGTGPSARHLGGEV